jgi:hypothetical protein
MLEDVHKTPMTRKEQAYKYLLLQAGQEVEALQSTDKVDGYQ